MKEPVKYFSAIILAILFLMLLINLLTF